MAPSRAKPILGILSIILSIVQIYALFWFLSQANISTPFYLKLISSVISSFNVSILFSWLAFGVAGGIATTALAITLVFWFDLRTEIHEYHILMLSYFLTAFIGYRLCLIKDKFIRSYALKMEKLGEEMNILSADISRRNSIIASLEEKLTRYSLLKEVVEALSAVLQVDEINNLIMEKTAKILGKKGRMLLFLVDTEKQALILSASKDVSKVKAKQGDIFDHWVLRQRKSLIVEDIKKDFRFAAKDIDESKDLFRSLIAAPLISESKIIGMLRLDNPAELVYTQDDLRLLDIIADLGAVALENALLYFRAQELAIRDGLTGLVVRRYFIERMKEEIKRAARKKDPLSLLMLDIDHFKDYNDKYGHTAGDLILKHLAKTISSMVEPGDIVVRYGGEEIGVLIYGKGKNNARLEAEAIRKEIKNKSLILRRRRADMTVSIGVSSYPEDAFRVEELIKVADERLYKAKADGRDRVCSG